MLSFLLLLVILVSVGSFSGYIAKKTMSSYFDKRMEAQLDLSVEKIVEEVQTYKWQIEDEGFHDHLRKGIFDRNIRYELIDPDGHVVMSNIKTSVNNPDEQGIAGPKVNGIESGIVEKEVPIIVDGLVFASLRTKFFNASMLNSDDILLVESIYDSFKYMIVGIFIVCLFMSLIIARGITKPIRIVGDTANSISEGNLKVRAHIETNTKELIELSEDINLLASKLEQEDLLRSQVTSDMAHEIRTPLTTLRNFFEAFIDGVYEVNETNLNKCHEEVVRMSDLVDRLKDIANIEAMTIYSNPSMVSLNEEIMSICDFSMPAFEKKEIALSYEFMDTCVIKIDPNHFRQTLTNLISNSLRYTDKGDLVKVTLEKKDGYAIISVIDNGIGISEADLPNIFERFYRADKSRDKVTGGIGVGLTIVKKMTEYYGGTISVESVLGEGSSFILKYPFFKQIKK